MKNAVPKYMQKGSRGPHVTLVHVFLCGLSLGEGVVCDKDYGDVTAAKVAEFQALVGLETDGNFGPDTRAAAKTNYDFDFEGACRTISDKTVFLQPDGTQILWGA